MASSTTAMTAEQSQVAFRRLLEGPAMSPPPGVIPNYHDPPNLDAMIALTAAVCVTFGTLAVLLRMYTKVFILRALVREDCRFLSVSYKTSVVTLLMPFRCTHPSMGKVARETEPVFH